MVPSRSAAPVDFIPGDEVDKLEVGLALCLSGGGYRAMVFHVGALWRLNELGLIPRIARYSSVSGGSITAATLGLNWKKLELRRAMASPRDSSPRSSAQFATSRLIRSTWARS